MKFVVKATAVSLILNFLVAPIQNLNACTELVGLENIMMKSEASAEDILVNSMNRLGYGVHSNSYLNTKTIRDIEKTKGKREAIKIIAAEIRNSFNKLANPNYFPHRSIAGSLSNHPDYGPYKVNLSGLKNERERFISNQPEEMNRPLIAWRQHAKLTQQIRKISDGLNEKEFNAPSIFTSFWFNHFNVDAQKVKDTTNHYELALRQNVCSNFYQILLTSAKHPAMNEYLDNTTNVRGKLNENYAREVIELHTIGSGPITFNKRGEKIQVYTADEIIEAAKVLSGWNYNKQTYDFEFRPALNEKGNKNFSTLFKNTTITESEGVAGGERFLKLLAQHPRTQRNVCRKIGTHLYGMNPGIEAVEKCISAYGVNGNLPKMYESFILSSDFWDKEKFFKGTKNPFENLISSMRGMGLTLHESTADAKTIVNLTILQSANFGEPLYTYGAPTGFKRLKRASTPTNLISNRLDSLNRYSDFSRINFEKSSNASLEKKLSNYVIKNGSQESFNYIVNDVAPVFPGFIKNNREIATETIAEISKPDEQDGIETPLKTTLIRLLSSGAFLRK